MIKKFEVYDLLNESYQISPDKLLNKINEMIDVINELENRVDRNSSVCNMHIPFK